MTVLSTSSTLLLVLWNNEDIGLKVRYSHSAVSTHTLTTNANMTFKEEDRCLLRLVKLMHCTARDILHYVFILGTKGRDITKPLDHFLITVLGFTGIRLKSRFNKAQRERLLSDCEGNTYDVSLLWICIMTACFSHDTKCFWVSSWLEHLLTQVKNIRNNLMHEGFTGDQAAFMKLTEEIRQILVDILKAAGEVYSVDDCDTCRRIKELNQDINKVRDESLDVMDDSSYIKENLFVHKQKMVLTQGVEELRSVYTKWSLLSSATSPFEDMNLEVHMVYTKICLAKGDPALQTQDVTYEDLLQFVNTSNKRMSLGNVAQIILIEGVAGSGKSTLTKFMMSEWVNGNSTMKNLNDFDLLLFMECRNTCLKSFADLLSFLMPKTATKFNNDDFLKSVINLRLLLIVDGLDELNQASNTLLADIMELNRTIDITVLCTTRPEKVREFKKMVPAGYQITYLEMQGIPEDQRVEFILKYTEELSKVGKTINDVKGLTEFVTTSTHLKEHWGLPMNLMMVTLLWTKSLPKNKNSFATATKLYVEFIRVTKERLLRRLEQVKSSHLTLEDLEKKLERCLVTLQGEALSCVKRGDVYLTHEAVNNIRDVCVLVGLPSEEVIGAFLVQSKKSTSNQPLTQLRFIHKGIQELFGAMFILHRLENDKKLDVPALIHTFQQGMSFHGVPENIRQEIIGAALEILGQTTKAVTSAGHTQMCDELEVCRNSDYYECSSFTESRKKIRSKDENFQEPESETTHSKFKHFDIYSKKEENVKVNAEKDLDEEVVGNLQKKGKSLVSIFSVNIPKPSLKLYCCAENSCGTSLTESYSHDPTSNSESQTPTSVPRSPSAPKSFEIQLNSPTSKFKLMVTEPSTRAGPIQRALEEPHQQERGRDILIKCQNMLMQLGGLMYATGSVINDELAKELVELLAESGVENHRQWLGLLSEVDYDRHFVHAVFHRIPTLVPKLVEVDDTTVEAYSLLFTLGKPCAVKLRIRGSVDGIPCLRYLLKTLADKRTKIMVYLLQDFRHIRGKRTPADLVHFMFTRCNIKNFMGHLDANTSKEIPDSLQGMALVIEDDRHYQEQAEFLMNITNVVPHLTCLWLHVIAGTNPSQMKPLPHIRGNLRLYLSPVDDTNIEWATLTCRVLRPQSKEFVSLRFPRSGLSVIGCRHLLQSLRVAQVSVARGGMWVSSPNILREEENFLKQMSMELLGCDFHLVADDVIWST